MNKTELVKNPRLGEAFIKLLKKRIERLEIENKKQAKKLILSGVSQRSELLELVTEIANSNQVYSNTRHKLWAKKLISSNCG